MEAAGTEVHPERREYSCEDDQSDVANGNSTLEKQTELQIYRVRLIDTSLHYVWAANAFYINADWCFEEPHRVD